MDNTCWPHVIHMVIRVGCTVVSMDHEQQYIRQTTLYQELYQVLLCDSIQELFHYLTLQVLVHNIRTRFLILEPLNTSLSYFLYSLLHPRLKVNTDLQSRRALQDPRHKGYTSQTGEVWPFICTKAHQCYDLKLRVKQ